MKALNLYGWIALWLVIIGGICWGLVGLFDVYLITSIFGHVLGRIIYILVGVGAVYLCYLVYLDKFKKNTSY
jgi:uncharacterized membrane protein YuzA (DUF378 family)